MGTSRTSPDARRGWRLRAAVVLTGLVTVVAGVLPAQAATSSMSTASDPTIQTNGRVRAILTVGGVTYLGGTFTSVRPAGAAAGTGETPRANLAAVDTATGTLLSWAPAADKEVDALAASADGTAVYIGGLFGTLDGAARKRFAAVTASNGTLLPLRADTDGRVLALYAGPTTLYLGGTFTTVNGAARSRAAALDLSTGVLSTAWAPVADDAVRVIVPTLDGKALYVGGAFSTINGLTSQKRLAKLGAADASVQVWKDHPSYPVWSVVPTTDAVYLGGDGSGGHAGRYSLDGTRGWVTQTDGGVQAIALIDGVLYVGGHFDNVCIGDTAGATTGFHCPSASATRHKLLAVDAATGATDPWDPGANSPLGVFALTGANSKVQVGGDFTAIGHLPGKTGRLPRQGYAQFGPSSAPAVP